MTLVFMFPGQSSRYPGMLEKLVELHPDNADTVARASEALGRDLRAQYAEGNAEAFARNRDIQIGVFLANHLFLRTLQREGIDADYSLGLSLGEWNHLVHIGALPFDQALLAVEQRGLAYDAGPRGMMASVFPISAEELAEVADFASLVPPAATFGSVEDCADVVQQILDVKPFGDWIRLGQAGMVTWIPAEAEACLGGGQRVGHRVVDLVERDIVFGQAWEEREQPLPGFLDRHLRGARPVDSALHDPLPGEHRSALARVGGDELGDLVLVVEHVLDHGVVGCERLVDHRIEAARGGVVGGLLGRASYQELDGSVFINDCVEHVCPTPAPLPT